MRFTIDVIFLDKDKRVMFLYPHMSPNRIMFKPIYGAKYTLEGKEGFINEHDVKIGDVLEWQED